MFNCDDDDDHHVCLEICVNDLFHFLVLHIAVPMGVAIDPENSMVYWCDHEMRRVSKVRYDGSEKEIVYRHPGRSAWGITIHHKK